jgi:hypothetical protein
MDSKIVRFGFDLKKIWPLEIFRVLEEWGFVEREMRNLKKFAGDEVEEDELNGGFN